jgi:DNA gyrase/topoisomerase IV subunit B
MNPLTRRLVPVEYPDKDDGVADMFEALLGSDIESRRMLIEEYFKMTSVDID